MRLGARFPLIALAVLTTTLTCVSLTRAQDAISVVITEVSATPIEGQTAYDVTAFVIANDSTGTPIPDLTAENFAVTQDGTPVTLTSAAVTQRPASFVLVIDISGSMAFQGKMDAVKSAAANFVNSLSEGDQLALIFFSDQVVVGQQLSADHSAAATIINLLEATPNGGTCLFDAAHSALTIASAAPAGQRAVLLLTDGVDEKADQSGPCSQHTLEEVLALATGSVVQVPIFTIGVGTRLNTDELQSIADTTGGVFLQAPTTEEVAGLFPQLNAQLKSQYELKYQAQTVGGQHAVTVTITKDGVTAADNINYIAPDLPPVINLSGLDDGALLDGEKLVRATVNGAAEVSKVTFTLNGQILAEDDEAPFEATLSSEGLAPGVYSLVVVATLPDESEVETTLGFEIQGAAGGEEPEEPEEETGEEEAAEVPAIVGQLPIIGGISLAVIGLVVAVIVIAGRRRKKAPTIMGGSSRPTGVKKAELSTSHGGPRFGTMVVQKAMSLRAGQPFDLTNNITRIGRGADNDVVVPDAPVSRYQAELHRQGASFVLFDLGSTYGTFVNDVKVGEQGLAVKHGDTIRLGTQTALTFNTLGMQSAGSEDRTMDFGAEQVADPDLAATGIMGKSQNEPISGRGHTVGMDEDESQQPPDNPGTIPL